MSECKVPCYSHLTRPTNVVCTPIVERTSSIQNSSKRPPHFTHAKAGPSTLPASSKKSCLWNPGVILRRSRYPTGRKAWGVTLRQTLGEMKLWGSTIEGHVRPIFCYTFACSRSCNVLLATRILRVTRKGVRGHVVSAGSQQCMFSFV